MSHSRGNKHVSKQALKGRAAQETSRIMFGSYVMNLTHSLFDNIINSSLGGAFSITALNSLALEMLARSAVGIPFAPKTKAQLQEIDDKHRKSNNPYFRFIAKVTGKKSISAQALAKSGTNSPVRKPVAAQSISENQNAVATSSQNITLDRSKALSVYMAHFGKVMQDKRNFQGSNRQFVA